MKLPNADQAVVDIRKLRDYSLNLSHDTGKHKARKFVAALGLTAEDAESLRQILLSIVQTHEAEMGLSDAYGQRYSVDFVLEWQDKVAQVRSSWIIMHGSTVPRLTSCYVL
ncbi:MAG: hypothetical protein R3D55_20455 [Chloroflexota bacterium]